ncbi:MAG: hypothetical protein HYV09_04450 [Deltaproteobacteria bacterium]|nr:hypothetical protein [Deltaproteobacteria bacterium]
MRNAPTSHRFVFVAIAAIACSLGCKEEKQGSAPPQGTPPPSAPVPGGSAAPGVRSLCEPAEVGVSDAKLAALLPPTVDGFCVRKADQIQSFGEGTPKKIEDVSDVIDGQGEIYAHNYFAKRYDRVHYVDARGNGAEVEINLSTFDKPENAYALFTYQVVANKDPDPKAAKAQQRTPPRPIGGGGAAALGKGNAYLWRGNYLVELTYSPDPTKPEAEAVAAADAILQKMVRAIGDKIVGATDPPADVRLLPTEAEGRVPLGIDYVPGKFKKPEGKGDALYLNVGSYATAFMRDGDKRYRVLAFARDETDAARDVMAAFAKLPGAVPLKEAKEVADDGWYFPFSVGQGGAGAAGKAEGVAARKGNRVLAVIDEELALGDPGKKDEWPRLSKDEKLAKLRALLARPAGASSAAPSPSAAPSASAAASIKH